MNRFSCAYALVALLAFAATPALADDMMWHGAYIGVNLGATGGEFQSVNTAVTPTKRGGNISGGAQVGVEWPGAGYTLGVEADIDAIDVRARSSFSKFDENWTSTIRGRLGLPEGDCTPFVSAGIAFTNVKETFNGVGSHTDTRTGFTGGVGADLPSVVGGWDMRLEYLYVQVPKKLTFISTIPFDGGSANHTIRVDFNYPL